MENDHRSLVGKSLHRKSLIGTYDSSHGKRSSVSCGKKFTQKVNIKAHKIVHIQGK